MSKQNKARQKQILAEQFTKLRKEGGHGPASTEAKHGKSRNRRWRAVAAAKLLEEAARAEAALAKKEAKNAKREAKAASKGESESVRQRDDRNQSKSGRRKANPVNVAV